MGQGDAALGMAALQVPSLKPPGLLRVEKCSGSIQPIQPHLLKPSKNQAKPASAFSTLGNGSGL